MQFQPVQESAARVSWARLVWIRRWAGEPLVVFLAFGALIFAVHALLGAAAPTAERRIEVSAFDLERIRALARKQWGSEPGPAQMRELIERHVHEEILYREAIAAGLDRDDVIVRRRLAQKMEFLAQENVGTPGEAQLQDYFRTHAERYRGEPAMNFEQVVYSRRERGAGAVSAARAALAGLRGGSAPAGDASMLPASYAGQSVEQVARDFGAAFAQSLFGLPTGSWTGPLESPYGAHLVRVTGRSDGAASFDAQREQVRADWLNAQIQLARNAAYAKLRARYTLHIAPSGSDQITEAAR